MSATSRKRRSYQADLNVTPLVDVVLVLLIIFMVVTPMMRKGPAVELPAAGTAEKAPAKGEPLILTVTHEQKLVVGDTEIPQPALAAHVGKFTSTHPNAEVVIQGDKRSKFKHVKQVLDACNSVGARRLSIATKENKGT